MSRLYAWLCACCARGLVDRGRGSSVHVCPFRGDRTMTKGRTQTALNRRLATLLVACLAVFVVVSVVDNHGPLVPAPKSPSFTRPAANVRQPSTCIACLASHLPTPPAGGPVAILAQQRVVAFAPEE